MPFSIPFSTIYSKFSYPQSLALLLSCPTKISQMGCCISKCKPKKTFNSGVQDKLVISQSPPSTPPSPPRKKKIDQSPPSITFTCSTQNSTCGSSLSSASSSSSSVVFPKVDRSFSNEFLQSCAMENPQVIGLDPTKKIQVVKQLGPGSTQKRARASSPTLTRQKSFRVEKDGLSCTVVNGRSIMRSPSPSRRFVGYTSNYQRQPTLFSMKSHDESDFIRRASPNRNVICQERPMIYSKKKERFGYEVGSKVDGVKVGKVLSNVNYSRPVPMEDLDNPHIALDCFIFV